MGSGEVAIVALSTMISLKVTFSDGLGGVYLFGLKALTNYSKNYTLLFHDGKICQKYAILRYVS